MPFDATVTFEDGSTHLYQGVPDGTAPGDVAAMAQKDFGKPVKSLDGGSQDVASPGGLGKELLRVGAKAVQTGLPALPGLVADTSLSIGRKLFDLLMPPEQRDPAVMDKSAILRAFTDGKFGDATTQLETAGGNIPKVEPQTRAGQVAGNIGASMVSNMTAPGSGTLPFKAAMGAGQGVGAEVGGALSDQSPVAKILGAIVGGGAVGGAHALMRPNAAELVKDATSHVRPEDWSLAAERQALQEASGIPALASQNVERSTLPDMTAVAGTNPKVGPRLKTAVQGSQQDAADAMNVWTNKNLPPSMGATDSLLGAQEKATGALQEARNRAGSAYGGSVPAGLDETKMPKPVFDAMVAELQDKIAQYGPTSQAGQALQKFIDTKLRQGGGPSGMQGEMNALAGDAAAAPTDITKMGWLNQLYKDMNQLGKADGYEGLPVRDIRQVMKTYTPEYDAARSAWRDSMANDYAKSAQGLTGELANYKGGPSWDKNTVNSSMLEKMFGGGADNRLALEHLAGDIGDDQVGMMLREHIGKVLDRTIRETKSSAGTLQTPADFVSSLAGNATAKGNVETALQIAARAQGTNPAEVSEGFWKLMDVLGTTKNLRLPDKLDSSVMQETMGKNVFSTAVSPVRAAFRYFNAGASTNTANEIASIVTSKDGLLQLQRLAAEKDPMRMQQLVEGILADYNRERDAVQNPQQPTRIKLEFGRSEVSPRIMPR